MSVVVPSEIRLDSSLARMSPLGQTLSSYNTDTSNSFRPLFLPRDDLHLTEIREDTFNLWPHWVDSSVSIQELVRTGFYYTGDADIVRCHSCKVQVQRWRTGMDPMEVHLQRSPRCEFLRTLAVPHRMAELPVMSGSITERRERSLGNVIASMEQTQNVSENSTHASRESDIDATLINRTGDEATRRVEVNLPSDYSRTTRSEVTPNPLNEVSGMMNEPSNLPLTGVSNRGDVREVSRDRHYDDEDVEADCGEIPTDFDSDSESEESDDDAASSALKYKVTFKNKSEIREENERLRRTIYCRKCEKEKVQTLFLPCRHLVTCESCSEDMEVCLHCNETILGTVRTFLT